MSTTYTHAEIRGAILRAADRIERDPTSYDYLGGLNVPRHGCGTIACMWGWIGFELGMEAGTCNASVAEAIGASFRSTDHLYSFCRDYGDFPHHEASTAPAALRAYADKYYPAVAEVAESADTATWASVKQATGWVPARLVRS
jgi:hypothetical protein